MKTPWVIGVIVGAHVLVIGSLFLMQGCGTAATTPASSSADATTSAPSPTGPVVMPPVDAEPTPLATVKAPKHPAQWPETAVTHVVQNGESLSTIAKKYGLTTTEIAALNGVKDANKLRVGQKLLLPAQADMSNVKLAPTPPEPAKTAPKAPSKTAAKPTVKPPEGSTTYVVQKGDSLSEIAHKFGLKTAALRAANGIEGDKIKIGQKLAIPPGGKAPAPVAVVAPAPAPVVAPVSPVVPPAAAVIPAMPPSKPAPAPVAAPVKPVSAPVKPAVAPAPVAPAPVAPPPAAPVAAKEVPTRTYVVQPDQDLYSVAMMWGVSVNRIKELNGLSDTKLTPGQRLKIPLSE